MKKFAPLCVIVIISLLVGCAARGRPSQDTLTSINLIDRNGMSQTISTKERLKAYERQDFCKPSAYQKVMRVYRNRNGDSKGIITSYHPNGELKQYLEVKNGRAHGTYKEYTQTGVLRLDAFVIGGIADLTPAAEQSWLFDGTAKAYDEQGRTSAVIPYEKGALHGLSVYYHGNGSVAKTIPYKEGKVDGIVEAFDESGKLIEKTLYTAGTPDGVSQKFWPDTGNSAAQEKFVDGKLMEGVYYDAKGKVVAQIVNGSGYRAIYDNGALVELQQYTGGALEGEIKSFSKQGTLTKVYHVKDGIKDGEEVVYYDTPSATTQPLMSVQWHRGLLQGTVKTWYPNGQVESQRELADNKKHGVSTAWYRNGDLMMIEEYEADHLKKGQYLEKGSSHPVSRVLDGNGTVTLFGADGAFLRKIEYCNGEPAVR